MFKDKAVEVAKKLLPAFNTATGIPMAMINIHRLVIPYWPCDTLLTPASF